MATKKELPQTPHEKIVHYRALLAKHEAELQTVVEQSLDDAESPLLRDERLRIRDLIELAQAGIARCEKQIEAERVANSAESVAAKTKAIDDAYAAVIAGHAKLERIDESVCELLDQIALKLHERQAVVDEQTNAAYDVVQECTRGQPDRVFRNTWESLRSALTHEDARAAIAARLYSSGLGRVGVSLLGLAEIRPVTSGMTLQQVRERAERRVGMALGKLIKQRKQRIEGAA